MTTSNLAVVSTFRSIADAQIAKGLLDGAGIESLVRTDDVGGMYPAMGGAVLMVRLEDVQTAREALNTPPPPSAEDRNDDPGQGPA